MGFPCVQVCVSSSSSLCFSCAFYLAFKKFVLSYWIFFCLFALVSCGFGWVARWGGVGGGETVIKIECMKKIYFQFLKRQKVWIQLRMYKVCVCVYHASPTMNN